MFDTVLTPWDSVYPLELGTSNIITPILKTAALQRANVLNASAAWGSDEDAQLLAALVRRIEALEAELAGRDAQIAAWLRKQSSTGLFFATAIEAGAYREDSDAG